MGLREAIEDFEEPMIGERLVGLIVIAVAAGLAAVLIALAALELFVDAFGYTDWTVPRIISDEYMQGVQVYPEHYLLVGAILLIPMGYLFALAVGIARARGWAWILGFVAGGLIAPYGLLALVIPGNAAANADRWHLDGLPPLVIGVFLLWYFNRRAVRRDLGWGDPAIG